MSIFPRETEIIGGEECTVITINNAVRCLIDASDLARKMRLNNIQFPEPYEHYYSSTLDFKSVYSECTKLAPFFQIKISWKDNNYNNPPSEMEVSAVDYKDYSYNRTIKITDFLKDLENQFGELIGRGYLY